MCILCFGRCSLNFQELSPFDGILSGHSRSALCNTEQFLDKELLRGIHQL